MGILAVPVMPTLTGPRLLQQTLEEEKATDAKLTAIAESKVNQKAA
jgi:ferritin-like metal-binding protein YciE